MWDYKQTNKNKFKKHNKTKQILSEHPCMSLLEVSEKEGWAKKELKKKKFSKI